MSTKHTPGPWHAVLQQPRFKVVSDEVIGPYIGKRSAHTVCRLHIPAYASATVEANARLIASAPGLLEALRDLVRSVDEVASSEAFKGVFLMAQVHGHTYSGPNFSKEWQKARDLLAKIDGEQP